MPIAEDPDPRPSDEPEPTAADPFDGLVLDEDFVRGAGVKEPAARTRILAARWRLEPPVDPGGRRWSLDAPARPARVRSGPGSRPSSVQGC
ncbi:SCO2583/SCO2584 N-terminal domain-containing protein [Saccharothrix sp. ST-888]|uniref:SCO2583/SCO2584 N-terminal domain-containing protein n=1 Tax=Saccharothrix sp. ST-888 TaxID=1427391 RepID=UPI000AC00FCC